MRPKLNFRVEIEITPDTDLKRFRVVLRYPLEQERTCFFVASCGWSRKHYNAVVARAMNRIKRQLNSRYKETLKRGSI